MRVCSLYLSAGEQKRICYSYWFCNTGFCSIPGHQTWRIAFKGLDTVAGGTSERGVLIGTVILSRILVGIDRNEKPLHLSLIRYAPVMVMCPRMTRLPAAQRWILEFLTIFNTCNFLHGNLTNVCYAPSRIGSFDCLHNEHFRRPFRGRAKDGIRGHDTTKYHRISEAFK